jgi:transposase-like protein
MRYPASEKLEIIRTVDASHLPTKQTLRMLGIPSSTYYDWYARWEEGGVNALADRRSGPRLLQWSRASLRHPARQLFRPDRWDVLALLCPTPLAWT